MFSYLPFLSSPIIISSCFLLGPSLPFPFLFPLNTLSCSFVHTNFSSSSHLFLDQVLCFSFKHPSVSTFLFPLPHSPIYSFFCLSLSSLFSPSPVYSFFVPLTVLSSSRFSHLSPSAPVFLYQTSTNISNLVPSSPYSFYSFSSPSFCTPFLAVSYHIRTVLDERQQGSACLCVHSLWDQAMTSYFRNGRKITCSNDIIYVSAFLRWPIAPCLNFRDIQNKDCCWNIKIHMCLCNKECMHGCPAWSEWMANILVS